jgi:hypothetical protein
LQKYVELTPAKDEPRAVHKNFSNKLVKLRVTTDNYKLQAGKLVFRNQNSNFFQKHKLQQFSRI